MMGLATAIAAMNTDALSKTVCCKYQKTKILKCKQIQVNKMMSCNSSQVIIPAHNCHKRSKKKLKVYETNDEQIIILVLITAKQLPFRVDFDSDNWEVSTGAAANMEAEGGNTGFKIRYFQTTC